MGYSSGTNYFSSNFDRNLELVNLIFGKNYTDYAGQDPGNINGELYDTYSYTKSDGTKVSYAHKGVDFRAKTPINVYSPIKGKVICTGDNCGTSGYGMVAIYNSEYDMTLNFQHLSGFNVAANDEVDIGTLIGRSGEKGATGSPHLHLGLREGYKSSDGALDFTKTTNADPRIALSFNRSYFDGAGSLVYPSKSCFGCQKDIAMMHARELPSTVVFQVKKDATYCNSVDITSDYQGEVIVASKPWDIHTIDRSIKTTLPLRLGLNFEWNTISITTTKPLSKGYSITATCNKETRSDKSNYGKIYTKFQSDYYWSGNGSLISENGDGYGANKDEIATFDTNKWLGVFQWQATSSCKKLKLSKTKAPDSYIGNIVADIKGWSERDWSSSVCTSLPCTLTRDGGYWLVKLKGNGGAVGNSGTVKAECVK